MRVRAPGKLVLTGAYAVLEGAPALVLAVDRYAVADTAVPEPNPGMEVRAALEQLAHLAAPQVDTRALHDAQGQKLGLGSSAAALVASLGALAAERGEDLARRSVRDAIFRAARAAHARTQHGGSGVDVASSVHGGLVRYQLLRGGLEADVQPVVVPGGLRVAAFWTGVPARTSELRARVDALRAKAPAVFDECMRDLTVASERAAELRDAASLVAAARAMGEALLALGRAADAPIVTPAMAHLAALAGADGAACLPSGAGGGDVVVHLGMAHPSEAFHAAARERGLSPLDLGIDSSGVALDPAKQKEH